MHQNLLRAFTEWDLPRARISLRSNAEYGLRHADTSAEIVDRLNKEINAALVDPKFKTQLANLDGTVLGGSPADFRKLIAEETDKWRQVIRLANIKPE